MYCDVIGGLDLLAENVHADLRITCGEVQNVDGPGIYSPGSEHDFGTFSIAVRAVLDRHVAVGLEIKPEDGHQMILVERPPAP